MKQPFSIRMQISLLTHLVLIFSMALCSPAFGQTEAQAGKDILILQKQSSSKTLYIEEGEQISYPVKKGNVMVDQKAEIIRFEEDGVVVQHKNKEEQVKVNLDELPYWRRHRPGMLTWGWILTVLGAASKALALVALGVALAAGAGSEFLGLFILGLILVLIFDPFSGLALVSGILLVSAGRKKISKPKWSWRLGKLLIKKAPKNPK